MPSSVAKKAALEAARVTSSGENRTDTRVAASVPSVKRDKEGGPEKLS